MMEGWKVKEECVSRLEVLDKVSSSIHEHYFVDNIQTPYKHQQSLIPLYTFVYEMCTAKPSYDGKMLQFFKAALQNHIIRYMNELNVGVKNGTLIQTYNKIWESYLSFSLLLVKRVFPYLDRYYLQGQAPLIQIAFQVYRETFFTKSSIAPFFDSYVNCINRPRERKIISNFEGLKFSKSVATIALNMQLFPALQQIYIREAAKFYESMYEQNREIQPMSYMNLVNNLTFFEKNLQKKSICLNLETIPHIRQHQIATFKESEPDGETFLFKLFEQHLVKNYTDEFIRHPYGFSFLLRNQQTNNLKIVYQIYSQYEGFEKLREALYNFILSEGQVQLKHLSEAESPDKFISTFYEFYMQYSKLVAQGLNKNEEMLVSLNNAVQKLASKFEKVAEKLFQFTRSILDKGKLSDEKQKITTIFQKLAYKDDFLNMYRQSLEKKIIDGKLVYMIEKQFISEINKICGSEGTANLDRKLQDFLESMPEDLIVGNLKEKGFNAKVVSLQLWEKKFKDQMTLNLTLIEPARSIWFNFQNVYCERFPKRKLILLPFENKLTLSVMINKEQKLRLKCNLVQACILIYASLCKEQVRQENLITDLTLEKSFLQTFLQQIPQILVQKNIGIYEFNWNFDSSQSVLDLDATTHEEKEVTMNIQQDRQILIQAAIIKATKKEKELTFEQLVEEVCKRIKLFKPHPSSIKLSCEKLAKKDMICEEGGLIKYLQ